MGLIDQCPAVQCTDVSFAYTAKCPVLNELSMSVPQSSIYSLLGASSSGKTTLVKIITGLLKANSGTIHVFGQKTGSASCMVPGPGVGFMPQDLCLYPHFSIETTLTYYAQINGMKIDKIKDRIQYLQEFLELPDPKRMVAKLSGGQQRRVSLAVAFIHDPMLVILDEPTVGIDPLLRNKIWSYLHKLRDQGQTILITTHYIEETITSDWVSFIHKGKLVCEQNPQKLMQYYRQDILESVLYLICRKVDKEDEQENESNKETCPANSSNIDFENFPFVPECSSKPSNAIKPKVNFHQFWVVTKQMWALLLYNILNVNLLVFYPPLIWLILNMMFYKVPDDIKVGVLFNSDLPNDTNSLESQIVNLVEKTIFVERYNSEETMIQDITNGRRMAGFVFASNYTDCVQERFEYGVDASDEMIECSKIRSFAETTEFVQAWTLAFTMLDSIKQTIQKYLRSRDINPDSFLPAIQFMNIHQQTLTPEFSIGDYLLLGFMSSVNFFIPMGASGLIWLQTRKHGMMLRSKVHDVSMMVFLLAHFVTLAFLSMLCCLLLVVVAWATFSMPIDWNLVNAYGIVLLEQVCSILVGQVIGIHALTQMVYVIQVVSLHYTAVYICGMFWPMDDRNVVLNYIGYSTPLTFTTEAMRKIFIKNSPITDPAVLYGYLNCLVYVVLCSVFCVLRRNHIKSYD